ncbi:MAG: trimethylamine methyltransferase family protein, partial [Planctomycetota bacterium]
PALEIFRGAGYVVRDNVVRFRRADVESMVAKAPSSFVRKGIEPSCDVPIGDGSLHFALGSIPLWIVDPDDYSRRDATYRDLLNFITLADALEHFTIANPVVQPPDIPVSVFHAVWEQAIVSHTGKPSCTWYATDRQTALDTIRILEAALGGRKALENSNTYAVTVCPDSTLQWGKSIWGTLELAKAGIPQAFLPMPFLGSTHPVTIPGALVQANAETLSAIVLAQLIRPGCPVFYAPSYGGIMDMSAASHAFGTPESALYAACATRLGKWYGLPVDMMMGTSDSKAPDAQAAYEKMMTMLAPALAGADCITQAGAMIGFALLASYEQLLVDNEICGQILNLVRPFEVNDETLAVDVIRQAGIAGHYVSSEHTYKHFRDVMYFPTIADRRNWQEWSADGSKDIIRRAKEKWPKIIAGHKSRGIGIDRRREVDRIVKDICDREKVEMTWLDGR